MAVLTLWVQQIRLHEGRCSVRDPTHWMNTAVSAAEMRIAGGHGFVHLLVGQDVGMLAVHVLGGLVLLPPVARTVTPCSMATVVMRSPPVAKVLVKLPRIPVVSITSLFR
jgi:hypothetical protein